MNSRFPLAAFQPGMVLEVGICQDGGVLLPAGSLLTERHLKQLRAWGVETVETEHPVADFLHAVRLPAGSTATIVDVEALGMAPVIARWKPQGMDSPDGKLFIVTESITHTEEKIIFEKSTVVKGEIGAMVTIESAADLEIDGRIDRGARISCRGNFAARGELAGTEEQPVIIDAERISLHTATRATLTARHILTAVSLVHCTARAGQEIAVAGSESGILAGVIEAGTVIKAATVGGDGDQSAVLRVALARQKQLFQALLQVEKTIETRTEEMARLEKVMEVIRLLGEKVVSLPPEKKQELALQSKRFMELRTEIADHERTRTRIQEETQAEIRSFDQCPIQLKKLTPGVELVIGAATLKLMARQGETGYYLRNGRIRALSNF